MIAVKPITVDEDNLDATNIAASEASEWDDMTTYALDDEVIYEMRHYKSLTGSNTDQPDVGAAKSTPTWDDLGVINRWRMFDAVPATVSALSGLIDVTVETADAANAIGLINVAGLNATGQVIDSDGTVQYNRTRSLQDLSQITNWYAYFFYPLETVNDLAFFDLPLFPNAKVRIIVSAGSGTAAIGEALIGRQQPLGVTVQKTEISLRDYSRIEQDAFGNYDITRRRFSKLANFRVALSRDKVGGVQRILSRLRSTPTLFVGDPDSQELILYGFYRDFRSPLFRSSLEYTVRVDSLPYDEPENSFSGASVNAPTIDRPDNEDTVPENTIFRTSAFATTPDGGDTHLDTDWEFASDATFDTIVHSSLADTTNLESYEIPTSTLSLSTDYWVRARHRSTTSGVSAYSTPVKFQFEASADVGTPTLTAPSGSTTLPVTLTSSAFATTPAAKDTHDSSDWQIASDAGFTMIVHESLADTANLESYAVPAGTLDNGTTYYARVRHNGYLTGASAAYSAGVSFTPTEAASQEAFTTVGTHTFPVPDGIETLCALLIGGGAGGNGDRGGGGGGLRWYNDIPVTPGEELTVIVPDGGAGNTAGGSAFLKRGSTTLLRANGGSSGVSVSAGGGGTTIAGDIGGGNGGSANVPSAALKQQIPGTVGGGGGAGGYSGDGGSVLSNGTRTAASGGAAAAGGHATTNGASGGGVGLLGEGTTGSSVSEAGSGGTNGTLGGTTTGTPGGAYGGGGGGGGSGAANKGAQGAARIIWGAGRAFPSTNTADE